MGAVRADRVTLCGQAGDEVRALAAAPVSIGSRPTLRKPRLSTASGVWNGVAGPQLEASTAKPPGRSTRATSAKNGGVFRCATRSKESSS